MGRVSKLLGRLSLRRRFLVAPALGVLLLGLLTLAVVGEFRSQNALVQHVATRDLAIFERYSALFTHLSEQHMGLYELLHDARRRLDEETLYDRAKKRLDAIRVAIDELEQLLPLTAEHDELAAVDSTALRAEVVARLRDYRTMAGQAVEMTTVNLDLAAGQLIRANDSFTAMIRAFGQLLDAEREGLRVEITEGVRRNQSRIVIIGLIGMAVAMLLFVLSVLVTRLLARSLEAQIDALNELGGQIEAPSTAATGDELSKISHAVGAFSQSLAKLREQEQALSQANRDLQEENRERRQAEHALVGALEDLGKVRDELEIRVKERTRELSEANAKLCEHEQQLQQMAFYDPLTGLANRALLDDRMAVALANTERNRSLLALLYVDLDRFKAVNDSHGHQAGDRLLVEIARRLRRLVRAADTIARMGGDEFVLLLANLDTEADATVVAARIIESVQLPVDLGGGLSGGVGASIGIAFYPRDCRDAAMLMKCADAAMYAAKQAGRGQCRVYRAESAERPQAPGVVSL